MRCSASVQDTGSRVSVTTVEIEGISRHNVMASGFSVNLKQEEFSMIQKIFSLALLGVVMYALGLSSVSAHGGYEERWERDRAYYVCCDEPREFRERRELREQHERAERHIHRHHGYRPGVYLDYFSIEWYLYR